MKIEVHHCMSGCIVLTNFVGEIVIWRNECHFPGAADRHHSSSSLADRSPSVAGNLKVSIRFENLLGPKLIFVHGCENVAGKLRQDYKATAGTNFTKPRRENCNTFNVSKKGRKIP